jgi:hypothetical protein
MAYPPSSPPAPLAVSKPSAIRVVLQVFMRCKGPAGIFLSPFLKRTVSCPIVPLDGDAGIEYIWNYPKGRTGFSVVQEVDELARNNSAIGELPIYNKNVVQPDPVPFVESF